MENQNIIDLEEELDSYKGQWFVINCYSGHEERVKSDLLQKIETSNLQNDIFDVRLSKLPTIGKNGKAVEKNKFPGYIFINMLMNDGTWFIVRNTPGVTGFIGSSGKGAKPLPITSEEVAKMLEVDVKKDTSKNSSNSSQSGNTAKKEKILFTASFKIEDVVLINSGPFSGNEGQVKEMDYEKGTAIVNVEMFGRLTPAKVNFDHLELAYKY